jgi:sporulation and spore germination protein
MSIKKIAGIMFLVLLFAAGVAGGYLYFAKVIPREKPPVEEIVGIPLKTEDLFSLKIYYPVGDHLQMEERRLPRRSGQMAIAEATVQEYLKGLKGPAGAEISAVPKDARLLGLYKGADRILYVDLSDEIRRNFQGDVFTEYLLLKGLYESLISNVEDVQDVKVIIEGKEAETLGGHLSLSYPLKDMVSYGY